MAHFRDGAIQGSDVCQVSAHKLRGMTPPLQCASQRRSCCSINVDETDLRALGNELLDKTGTNAGGATGD